MYDFFPFRQYFTQRNAQIVANAVEKLKKGSLSVEQMLDEDELLTDLKYPNTSQLVSLYIIYF